MIGHEDADGAKPKNAVLNGLVCASNGQRNIPKKTTLETCTLWSTLKIQRCFFTGDDVSRAKKGITKAAMVSKVTCNNTIRGHCCRSVI
jgi:hypothetical protein